MMAGGSVSHTGRILEVTPQGTTVRLESMPVCASCHAAGLCGMAEVREKLILVPTDPYTSYAPGEEVEVEMQASLGLKAVWLSYMIPLLLLLAVFFGVSALGATELGAGLAALGGVALYYLVLWLLRNRLRNEAVFRLKKR